MIKNLPPELVDLEIYMQKLIVKVNNLEKGDPRIGSILEEIAAIQAQIAVLTQGFELLAQKQDEQKLIQIVATQRTFKNTAGDADIPAADGSVGGLNAWNDRHLKYAEQTPESTDYFIHDPTNNRIYIAKPGIYDVYFETHSFRSNFWQVSAEYRPPSGPYMFKQVKGRTASAATAVGNEEHIASNMILNVESGREGGYLYLLQWVETNTTNFKYGNWWCAGSASAPYNYVDTCTLKVTLIKDI